MWRRVRYLHLCSCDQNAWKDNLKEERFIFILVFQRILSVITCPHASWQWEHTDRGTVSGGQEIGRQTATAATGYYVWFLKSCPRWSTSFSRGLPLCIQIIKKKRGGNSPVSIESQKIACGLGYHLGLYWSSGAQSEGAGMPVGGHLGDSHCLGKSPMS